MSRASVALARRAVAPVLAARGWRPAALLCGAALALACSSEPEPLFREVEIPALTGRGGRGSSGPLIDPSSQGGGDAGVSGGDAGPDPNGPCTAASDCDDGNACTLDTCEAERCEHAPAPEGSACGSAREDACTAPDRCDAAGRCVADDAPLGTPCGSDAEDACTAPDSCDGEGRCAPNDAAPGTPCGDEAASECSAPDSCDGVGRCDPRDLAQGAPCGDDSESACTAPDSCDGAGACQPNHLADGAECPEGSCALGLCLPEQEGCPAAVAALLPFATEWSSVGRPDLFDTSCSSNNAPDFAVIFTAPAAGVYRFEATGSPDSVLSLAEGACAGAQAPLAAPCNDDIAPGGNLGSRIDATLAEGETVTAYVSEFGVLAGGSGTFSITAL